MNPEALKFLFSVGSISFYELQPITYIFSSPIKFYWKDYTKHDYHGPYDNLNQAMEDCKRHLREAQPKIIQIGEIPNNTNIIPVNFTTKKRIKI